jgi:protein TonB
MRDDFLLDLGESLGGQVSITPVESVGSCFPLFSPSSRRTQLLVIDARDVADIRGDIEQAQYQLPNTTMLVFAPADSEKQIAAALKGSNIFAVLPIPIDRRKTAAVFEGALTDATARRQGARSGAYPEVPAEIVADERSSAASTGLGETGESGPNKNMLIAAAVAVVLLGGGAFWYFTQGDSAPSADRTPARSTPAAGASQGAQPGSDPTAVADIPLVVGTVDELLEKARAAMRERRYTEPTTDNALLYYRSALGADPSNGEAADGVNRVATLLLARLEEATTAGRYEEAAGALAALKTAIPADPRLGPLEASLLQGQINRALSDANFERVNSLLRDAQRSNIMTPEQVAKITSETKKRQEEAKVSRISALFNEALDNNRLTEPANNNAKYYAQQLREASPGPVAQRAQRDLLTAFLRKGREAATGNRPSEVEKWIAEAKAAGASATEIRALERDVANARARATAAEGDRLASLAQQRVRDGRLTEPATDSAAHYLTELRNTDAGNAALAPVARELAIALISRASTAAREGKAAQVDADLNQARRWGADESEILRVKSMVRAQPAQPVAQRPGGSATPEGPAAQQPAKLKRVRYAAPEYPPKALDERLSGYVTIDFVVNTNGEPTDLRVVDAKPADVFDRAALAAVRRWRYEPVIVNNVPTEVPNRTVIRFELPK